MSRNITIEDLFCSIGRGGLVVAEKMTDQTLVHVDAVVSGASCGCRCPGCGGALIAKKGSERVSHFAHASGFNPECPGAGETVLHRLAKEHLASSKRIRVPGIHLSNSYASVTLFDDSTLHLDRVELERRRGAVVPDVICTKGDRELFVEIVVTHACDEAKIEKLKLLDVGVIEVDLSSYRHEPIRNVGKLVERRAPRKWLHNKHVAKAEAELDRLTAEKIAMRQRANRASRLPRLQSMVRRMLSTLPEEERVGFSFDRWMGSYAKLHETDVDHIVETVDEFEWKMFFDPLNKLDWAFFRSSSTPLPDLCLLPLERELERRGGRTLGDMASKTQGRERPKKQRNAIRLDPEILMASERRKALTNMVMEINPVDGKDWLTSKNRSLANVCPLDAAGKSPYGLEQALDLAKALQREHSQSKLFE